MASWGTHRRSLLAAVAITLVCAGAIVGCHLPGPQFTVDRTDDRADANPGDGLCAAVGGGCTLRAAVMEADAEPGSNDIDIGDGHTFQLTIPGPDEDAAATGDLDITDSVSINGASTVDANQLDRAFDVHAGTLILDGATVRNGRALANQLPSGVGGAIDVGRSAGLLLAHADIEDSQAANGGGGIHSLGQTQVFDSQVRDNRAGDDSPAVSSMGDGGGIGVEAGQLTIVRTTIDGNALGGWGRGAGVAAESIDGDPPVVLVDSSTISHNHGSEFGEVTGLDSTSSAGQVTIRNSTFSGNRGDAEPDLDTDSSTVSGFHVDISASTFADNTGAAIGWDSLVTMQGTAIQATTAVCGNFEHGSSVAEVTSGGYNFVSDASCRLGATTDLQGGNPLLGLLADNGGPTLTQLPFANSPLRGAIPVGAEGLCPASGATDQRAIARATENRCTIGSVEGGSSEPAVPLHLTVTSAGDTHDGDPGNGVCDGGAAGCTLRAAIEEANAYPTADGITISPGVDPTLTLQTVEDDDHPSPPRMVGHVEVTSDLVIDGNGATITATSFTPGDDVVLHRHNTLAIVRATLVAAPGRGDVIDSSAGNLSIADTTIRGVGDQSTGLFSWAPVAIESSTFVGHGRGAISVIGSLDVHDSTFTGNSGDWVIDLEEPLHSNDDHVRILSSTIAGNDTATPIKVNRSLETFQVSGSIVTYSGSCNFRTNVPVGFNMTDSAFCPGQPGDTITADTMLAPLADNGGPTQTRLILNPDPVDDPAEAIDAIPVATPGLCDSSSFDQRHVARPIGPACDIGATEGTAP